MFSDTEMMDDATKPAAKTPPAPLNPFGSAVPSNQASNALAATDQSRAIAETQAAMVIAQRFPRNQIEAMDKILDAFTRPGLAEKAQYAYARGGSDITGPSIRSAEAIAQLWGNMQVGVRELEQRPGESTVEAFAWDIQSNTRETKVFQVAHIRYTKKGSYRLEDPRDIYELIANQGARRKRACILAVIPGDVVEAAMKQADVTLHTKAEVTPERLASLQEKFAELGVTKEQIEKRIQRRIDAMTPALLVNLGKIYNSIRDGMSSPVDWFEAADAAIGAAIPQRGAAGLKAAATAKAAKDGAKVDPDTGEVTGAADNSPLSYAYVMAQINEATTRADADVAETLLPRVAEEKQRADLDVELRAKRKQIAL